MAATSASAIPHATRIRVASLASLRAAGTLVASSRHIHAVSVTLPLRGTDGEALIILRWVERIARGLRLRHRVEVGARTATVHLWRERQR